MLIYYPLCCLMLSLVSAETSASGIRPTNILGGADQHASFSFVRPGLTQTSYAFNGPSSHQSFSSSVGDPHLLHKVLPNVAQALNYKNPGLGYLPTAPISTAPVYSEGIPVQTKLFPYQYSQDPAPITYLQQGYQIPSQINALNYPSAYQTQLLKLLALRQSQLPINQIPEQIQLQQQERTSQNLLGVAYSVAPSVARVKVTGNGYKFDF